MFLKSQIIAIGLFLLAVIYPMTVMGQIDTNQHGDHEQHAQDLIIDKLLTEALVSDPYLTGYDTEASRYIDLQNNVGLVVLYNSLDHENDSIGLGVQRSANQNWYLIRPDSEAYESFQYQFESATGLKVNDIIESLDLDGNAAERVRSLADYSLPWEHDIFATVSRSYSVHGTGKIDFDIDNRRVTAAKDGVIVYVNDSNTLVTQDGSLWHHWNTVVIKHADNEYSSYHHLEHDSVPEWIKSQCSTAYNQSNCNIPVNATTFIGVQGQTGYTFGEHLHFATGSTIAFSRNESTGVWTGYAWNLHNISFLGYSASEVANWSNGTRIKANHATSCCGCMRVAKRSEGSNDVPFALFGDGSQSSNVFGLQPQQFSPDCAIAETEFVNSNQATIDTFDWEDATDVDGEVIGYRVYWGEDANGVGDMFVAEPRYLPTERVADDVPVTRYLRISAEDNDGNRSAWHTVAVWEYDPVAPTGAVQINAGGQVVPMLGVDVRLDVQDEGSGVTEMRLSADSETWQDWEPFVTSADWTLDDTPAPQTVYAQVRDAAGNVSAIMSASVTVDLSNDPPSSASYSVNCSAMTQGGSQTSSSSYSLRSVIGQPHAASEPTSNSYQVRSGFWGCVGDTTTVPTAITLQQSETRRGVPLVILLAVAHVLAGGWWRLRKATGLNKAV